MTVFLCRENMEKKNPRPKSSNVGDKAGQTGFTIDQFCSAAFPI